MSREIRRQRNWPRAVRFDADSDAEIEAIDQRLGASLGTGRHDHRDCVVLEPHGAHPRAIGCRTPKARLGADSLFPAFHGGDHTSRVRRGSRHVRVTTPGHPCTCPRRVAVLGRHREVRALGRAPRVLAVLGPTHAGIADHLVTALGVEVFAYTSADRAMDGWAHLPPIDVVVVDGDAVDAARTIRALRARITPAPHCVVLSSGDAASDGWTTVPYSGRAVLIAVMRGVVSAALAPAPDVSARASGVRTVAMRDKAQGR